MPAPLRESFEITIGGKTGSYTVSARGPGVLTDALPFVWPTADLPDPDAALLKLESAFELTPDFVRAYGVALYEALFPEDIDDAYQRLVGQGQPFRLRLVTYPPELARLPWELLCDEQSGTAGWLALRHKHPFVRSVPNTDIAAPIPGKGPLRVAFVGASPKGWTALDVAEDERRLREGLKPLLKKGLVEMLDPILHLTPDLLRDRLRDEPHVLHFSGHGEFDEQAGTGHLILEDEGGQAARMGGDKLAVALRERSVRLVVLSACRTAQIDVRQPFVGVAQQLANAGNLPAVVAMQFPIGDTNAVAFNKEFYMALADRYPVDQAITEGRGAIWQRTGASGEGRALVDWATPVLFMLGHSGELWEESTVSDKEQSEKDEQPAMPSVSIGGSVGGDVKVSGRDIIEGDVVRGDKISIGDISGSKGIAIGRDAQAHVTEGADAEALARLFAEILSRLEALQGADAQAVVDAKEAVGEIRREAEKGDEADQSFLAKRFRNLARMGPEILDVVTATILNPAVGIATVVRKIAAKAREDAGLEPL